MSQIPGRSVTKSELMHLLWHDVIAEEANLNVQMAAPREAIGPDAAAVDPAAAAGVEGGALGGGKG